MKVLIIETRHRRHEVNSCYWRAMIYHRIVAIIDSIEDAVQWLKDFHILN